jgi:hypothetical protein
MMKNKIVLIFLLLSMSFSIVHGLVLGHDDAHCGVESYLEEFDSPSDHCDDDACNSHFMFHISYILPTQHTMLQEIQINLAPKTQLFKYNLNLLIEFFKPPIS